MINNKYGKLTVLSLSPNKSGGNNAYVCVCDCGKEKTVRGTHLKQGLIRSCGCLYKEAGVNKQKEIGKRNNPKEHKSWSGMIQRCYNIKNKKYYRYGGRGITVCDRWLKSFENFYKDMGDKPSSEYSLDRIDNNGNYEPYNCRWATQKQQANNRSNNRYICYMGINETVGYWEIFLKIPQGTLSRKAKSMGYEKAINFFINIKN